MRLLPLLRIGVPIAAICLCVQGQNPPPANPPAKEAPVEAKGLPPRATPADYQAHVQVGALTLAAEFTSHSVPTMPTPLSTEDYVVVETGMFGPTGARTKLSADDFSLRINGKKAVPNQPYGRVLASLKDPEWEPPEPPEKKSKSSLNTGGGGQDPNAPPPTPPKMPIGLQHAMWLRVQKAALPEGDRALPQAGVIFFECRRLSKGIRSVELIYNGPAGKATLTLQP